MAVAAVLDIDELIEQADALDAQADELRAKARELSQQAIELRTAVARLERDPVCVTNYRPGVGVERDERFLRRLTYLLGEVGPCKSSVLVEHLNAPQQRVTRGLVHLEKCGKVTRSGIRRGTIWGLAEDLDGHAPIASARTLVLDAARKLDTFALADIDVELQMLDESAIRRELKQLSDEGILSVVKDGRRNIYAFERPEGKPVNRPKHAPPETKLVRFHRRDSNPIQGTGRGNRPQDKDVRDLFEAITQAGGELVRLDNGHWQVKLRDQIVTVVPGTPSDWRSLRNVRADCRRAGLKI